MSTQNMVSSTCAHFRGGGTCTGGVKSAGITFVLGLASGLWAQSATPVISGKASGTVANATVADDQQNSANPAADNADSSRNPADANDNSRIAR